MANQNWKKIEEIFHLALHIPTQDRDQFLREHCSENEAIAGEVAKLLEFSDDRTDWEEASTNSQLQQAVSDVVDLLKESSSPNNLLPNNLSPNNLSPNNLSQENLTQENRSQEAADFTQHSLSSEPTRKDGEVVNRAAAELRIHQLLSRKARQYEFQALVGSGGGGTVARVWDKSLHRDVAFKVLHSPAHEQAPGSRDTSNWLKAEKDRLLAESRSLAQVQSDYIVQIFEVGDLDGTAYLVMEYIDGVSLRDYMRNSSHLPAREAAEIALEIATGLVDAHSRGLVHRDIKPSNILLAKQSASRGYRVKIIDFGLARDEDARTVSENISAIEGTPAYMAPELLEHNASVNPTVDVYALGVTLYQLLTGMLPFRGALHMLIKQKRLPVTPPRSLDDRIPTDLESVCLKAMSEAPDDRYESALVLKQDLERFLQGRPTIARPIGIWQQGWKWAKRNKAWAVAAASIMVLITALSLGSSVFATLVWTKNRAIERERQQTQLALEAQILHGDPQNLLLAIDQFERFTADPVTQLKRLATRAETTRAKININCALSILGEPTYAKEIVDLLPKAIASSSQCRVLAHALASNPRSAITALERSYSQSDVATQIRIATLEWYLGDSKRLSNLTDPTVNPDVRTEFIHGFRNWCPDTSTAIQQAGNRETGDLSTAVMLGLGCMDPRSFSDDELATLKQTVERNLADVGCPPCLASASRWLASQRQWKLATVEDLPFYMIPIRPGVFSMGNDDPTLLYEGLALHEVKITRPYLLSDREISVRVFRGVLADSERKADKAILDSWQANESISPTEAHPAQQVSWFEAVAFCNALSRQQKLKPCYIRSQKDIKLNVDGETRSYPQWVLDRTANGYRLPTEAEWAYAARAGTTTDYSFGNDRRYLEYYGLWSNNREIAANVVGNRMPNPWGLFDVHGNVWEWTQDWYRDYPTEMETDPCNEQPSDKGRTYRGGGVATYTGDPHSCARGGTQPDSRFSNVGFRVARNLDFGLTR